MNRIFLFLFCFALFAGRCLSSPMQEGALLMNQPVASGGGSPNPSAQITFDSNSTSSQPDATGNGNTCNFTSSPTWSTSDGGHTAGYQVFNGTSQYGTIASSSYISPTAAITVCFWVKPGMLSAYKAMVCKTQSSSWSNPYCDYLIRIASSGNTVEACLNNAATPGNFVSGSMVLSTGVWYHVAFTYDGTTEKLYINGTLDNSNSLSTAINASGFPLNVALDNTGTGDNFNCALDDLRIYTTALTQAQISSLVSGGAASYQSWEYAADSYGYPSTLNPPPSTS